MKNIIRTYRKTIAGLVVGAAVGFAYYALVGCSSGLCAITLNPWNSTLYGAVMGFSGRMARKEANNKFKYT